MLDVLLENGRYPDFEQKKLVKSNIGIKDGKIAYVGDGVPKAKENKDVDGLVVSPGFIDIHMHEENFANEGLKYVIADMMLAMGVTTAVGGNCGMQHQKLSDFKSGISALSGSPVNYIMLAGYNSYRYELGLGHYDRVDRAQMGKLRDLIARDLSHGAWGLSFGIEYDPGIFFEEMVYAAETDQDPDKLMAAHYRGDCIGNIDPVKEMVAFSKEIANKFQISHLSSCGALGLMQECLDEINTAMEQQDGGPSGKLNYDTYPYSAFATHIGSTVFEDGCLEAWHKDYSDILLSEEPFKNVRCTREIFTEARRNYPNMVAVAFVMNEDEIALAIKNKYGMVGSDGILTNGQGHPRAAGTFPRVLGKYVREEKQLSLVDALRKISLEPAKRLGIQHRKGQIKEGLDADLTVFSPEKVKDMADFGDIHQAPVGIEYVYVDGKLAARDGRVVSESAGRFLDYRYDR